MQCKIAKRTRQQVQAQSRREPKRARTSARRCQGAKRRPTQWQGRTKTAPTVEGTLFNSSSSSYSPCGTFHRPLEVQVRIEIGTHLLHRMTDSASVPSRKPGPPATDLPCLFTAFFNDTTPSQAKISAQRLLTVLGLCERTGGGGGMAGCAAAKHRINSWCAADPSQ
jgi:hypothetical protein